VRGRFRTRGRNSTATVRGTRYLVKDSCSGTLTLVRKGSVVVRDLVKHKQRVVRAGHRYLARPKLKRRR
jgi:ferric-dicitrate binding protein FerR (iron transport regulator)